jgi:hypothetical protein
VVGQVNQRHARSVAQAFGDRGPVLSLAEQAVKKDHAGPAAAQLSAEELVVGFRHGRRCQQLVCQCRRSSTGDEERSPGVSGQATTCGVPAVISALQPGHR